MASRQAGGPDKPRMVVTDSKGKVHEVKTDFLCQQYRVAWSPGRFILALILLLVAGRYIREHVENIFIAVLLLIVSVCIVRYFVMHVLISKEDKSLRRAKPGELDT